MSTTGSRSGAAAGRGEGHPGGPRVSRTPKGWATVGLGLAACLVGLGLLEVGSAVFVRAAGLPVALPVYGLGNAPFWRDINPDFGVWHVPGARFRHRQPCFDVEYRANAAGARDRERNVRSERPRVIMLGDSFIEGYGAADGTRLSDVLEAATGVEHLNFGASGAVGPLQYMLIYRTLARQFDHTGVVVGLLPDNDFLDSDLAHGRRAYGSRYRPYLVGEYPRYEIIHFDTDRLFRGDTAWTTAKRLVGSFSHAYNLTTYALQVAREGSRAATGGAGPARVYSGYHDFGETDWRRMRWTLERIVEDAGRRLVLVVTIPSPADFRRLATDGRGTLAARLETFGREIGFAYVDLLPPMAERSRDGSRYTLGCDSHWNAEGARTVAQVLLADDRYRRVLSAGVDPRTNR